MHTLQNEESFHLTLTHQWGNWHNCRSMTVLPSAIAISARRLRTESVPYSPSLARTENARSQEVRPEYVQAEQFAYQFGRTYDSYLVTEPGWEHFWSRGQRGMIAAARCGRHQFCGGGLLAPAEHCAELLAAICSPQR